jgi:hypothetical protein
MPSEQICGLAEVCLHFRNCKVTQLLLRPFENKVLFDLQFTTLKSQLLLSLYTVALMPVCGAVWLHFRLCSQQYPTD